MGWFTLADDFCSASNIENPEESRATSRELDQHLVDVRHIPKDRQASWGEDGEAGNGGEAGRYVEFHSRGGIMGYSTEATRGES